MSGAASTSASARGPRVWWRDLPRSLRRALLGAALLVLIVVGGLLARYLSAENAERADDLALVRAEARGDVATMLDRLSGCRADAKCVSQVRSLAGDSRVRQAGAIKLLQVESNTASSLFGATGETRVAWTVLGGTPVVQCIVVQRTGNPLTGIGVKLLSIGAPISNGGDCGAPGGAEEEAGEGEGGR